MGRPAQIDRAAVLAASLEVADDKGIDGVTMQAVADRLGVTPMALYRHVDNKADLLDGVVEGLLTEFPAPDPDLPVTERLRQLAGAVRASARRHPTVFPLLLQRPATTPGSRRVRETIYEALRKAGMAEEKVPRVERLLSTMVLGFAASEAGGRFAGCSREELDADFAMFERWAVTILTGEAAAGH